MTTTSNILNRIDDLEITMLWILFQQHMVYSEPEIDLGNPCNIFVFTYNEGRIVSSTAILNHNYIL